MSQPIEAARIALRERQGTGARYDAETAPARELDWARRGTAYFARLLNDMPNYALDEPSALYGFTRRRLIAFVGYHARLMSEMVAWARTGQEGPFPAAAEVSRDDLEFGVTQPSRALRYLFDHSQVHLNVEWRDLIDGDWDRSVQDATGRVIAVRDTPAMRARALWLHAIDLDAGGRFSDMPGDFLDELIRDLAAERVGAQAIEMTAHDRTEPYISSRLATLKVTGRAVDLARWLAGHGVRNLVSGGAALPAMNRWPPAFGGGAEYWGASA